MKQQQSILGINIRWWYLATGLLALFTVLRGIRYPSSWTYTHYLFNYDFGFVKRGFVGAVVGVFNTPALYTYESFFVFTVLISLANIVLLALVLRDFINSGQPALLGAALVFVSSMGLVYLAHTVGYFDHIGLLLTLIALRITDFNKKLIYLCFAMLLALLIHEGNLIMFFPVMFMSLVLSSGLAKTIKPDTAALKKRFVLIGVFALAVLVTAQFMSQARHDGATIKAMMDRDIAEANYPIRKGAYGVMNSHTRYAVKQMIPMWQDPERYPKMAKSLAVTLPAALFFIYLTVIMLRRQSVHRYLIILAVLAALSPLVLHALAYDLERWNTLMVATSFLMLAAAFAADPESAKALPPQRVLPLALVLVAVQCVSTTKLMDGQEVENFPFTAHREYISDFMSGKETFPWEPGKVW